MDPHCVKPLDTEKCEGLQTLSAIYYGSLGSVSDFLRLKRGPSVNSMIGTTAVALSNANVQVMVFQPAAS